MLKTLVLILAVNSFIYSQNIEILDKEEKQDFWILKSLNKQKNSINKVFVDINNTILKVDKNISTSIYILIDTSVPMKKAYNKGIKPFLKENVPFLVSNKNQVIISSFDKNIKEVYNSSLDKNLSKALKKIKIEGQLTELWRNSLEAIKTLKSSNSKRKVLIILSDGKAEDTLAYPIKDVIDKAKKENIRIVSIAYYDTIAVQNLRKVAEETNGILFIADKFSQTIKKPFLTNFNFFLRKEFEVIFPKSLLTPNKIGTQKVDFNFENNLTQITTISLNFAVNILKPPKPKSKPLVPKENNKNLYLYGGIGSFFILILLLWLLLRNKKEIEEKEVITEIKNIEIEEKKALAILNFYAKNEKIASFDIFKFPVTIGKKEGNDIVVLLDYISRNNAVIDFKDGKFYITDTNSANGILINNEKVEITQSFNLEDSLEFSPYRVEFIPKFENWN